MSCHLYVVSLNTCRSVSLQARSCLLRSRIQRANGSLGTVMSEPNVTSSSNPSLPDAVADSDLRWHNTVLTQVRTEDVVKLVFSGYVFFKSPILS